MRAASCLLTLGLAVVVAGCRNLVTTEPASDGVSALALAVGQATGPNNRCYGEIIRGITTTWPWAHADKSGFAPPKGSLALWVEVFGPGLGISSVRQLQLLFCSEP